MDYFGINSADELPKISEVLMEEYEKATAVKDILNSEVLDTMVPTDVKDEDANGIIDDSFAPDAEAAIDTLTQHTSNLEDVSMEEEALTDTLTSAEMNGEEASQEDISPDTKPEEEA